ncbi:MAG TPA: asparagine synthetase B family protein [Pyrinomonadaceae bacterium]|nr:asparagine synthetase B family protein [Pyrinomonadaceae bacterium]
MSVIIGYWSHGPREELQGGPHRLLTEALARAGCAGAKIVSSHGRHFPHAPAETTDPRALSNSFSFAVAAHGRHARLEADGASAQGALEPRGGRAGAGAAGRGVTAALSVSGAGAGADLWVRADGGGLVLGREAFGRATLFWTRAGGAVWFASRLGLLLSAVGGARVSVEGFYAYGCFSYVPAPLTPAHEVFAVPSGCEAVWCGATPEGPPRVVRRQEWREADEQTADEDAGAASLRRLLEESLEAQLGRARGEPVGVFLSGGLDSAVTAALLARAGADVRAYTLDFGGGCFSEVPYAEAVARSLGVPLTKVAVTPRGVRAALEPTAARLDALYGDGVTVPLALLCERASREVRVVFNGEGGDQLFAGWTNKPIIAASVYGRAGGSAADAGRGDEQELTAQELTAQEFTAQTFTTQTLAALYARTLHRLHGHEAGVYADEVRREIAGLDALAPLAAALDPSYTRGLLHRLRRANLMLKGADNIQPRAASLGLSFGLDVRTLFCSRPLAEWTFGVAGELWLRGGCEKYLFKRAVEGLLPAEVVWREKRGMGVPLTLWLAGRLRRWAGRQLSPRALAAEGLWRPDAPRRILSGELSGHVQGRRIGETLWLLLAWRAWRGRVLRAGEGAPRRASVAARVSRLGAALSPGTLGRRYT